MATTGAEAAGMAAASGVRAVEPEALFAEQFASLCRTAYLVLGDAGLAEEMVMEAFARTLPRWRAVESAEQPVAYLRRAVVNLCVSRVRRLVVERRAPAGAERVRWDTDIADEARTVLDAVRLLPARQRACIVLRYFDDLPELDIAAAMGCSVGTVKSQLSKARTRLGELLAEGGSDA